MFCQRQNPHNLLIGYVRQGLLFVLPTPSRLVGAYPRHTVGFWVQEQQSEETALICSSADANAHVLKCRLCNGRIRSCRFRFLRLSSWKEAQAWVKPVSSPLWLRQLGTRYDQVVRSLRSVRPHCSWSGSSRQGFLACGLIVVVSPSINIMLGRSYTPPALCTTAPRTTR